MPLNLLYKIGVMNLCPEAAGNPRVNFVWHEVLRFLPSSYYCQIILRCLLICRLPSVFERAHSKEEIICFCTKYSGSRKTKVTVEKEEGGIYPQECFSLLSCEMKMWLDQNNSTVGATGFLELWRSWARQTQCEVWLHAFQNKVKTLEKMGSTSIPALVQICGNDGRCRLVQMGPELWHVSLSRPIQRRGEKKQPLSCQREQDTGLKRKLLAFFGHGFCKKYRFLIVS